MDKKVYEGYKRTESSSKPASGTVRKITTRKKTTTTPNAVAASKISTKKPRIAMYIDVDNVGISRENLLEILFYVNGKYQVDQCRLYGFSEENLPGIKDIAGEYNLTTIGKMKFKQSGVNCLDSRLLIDAYECALNNRGKIDMIFVWCYPCDLAEIFEKIIALGVNTSTIDNRIFDCKNKFVSQTFKLYSPYNFTIEQPSYGNARNQPSPVSTSTETEKVESVETQTIVAQNDKELTSANSVSKMSIFDEGNVPPVLPRRSIPERSNPNEPKPQPVVEENPQTETTKSDVPSSLVEEIARKLNIDMSQQQGFAEDMEEVEKKSSVESTLIMDLLKQAGLDDFGNDEKVVKYEDTIGDL